MKRGLILGSFILSAFWLVAGAGTAMAGAEDGKRVFAEKKRINCHSLGSEKGAMAKLGGPLDGVGSRRDAAWLKGYFTDPISQLPNAKMPNQKLTEKQVEDLVQYVLTVK
jgi:mono/diheme cytochrome c family protein